MMSTILKQSIWLLFVLGTLIAQTSASVKHEQQFLYEPTQFNLNGNANDNILFLSRPRRQLPSPQSAQPETPANVFKFFSELGPQVEKAQSSAKMITSLFSSSSPTSGAGGSQQEPAQQLNEALQTAQLMSSLSGMLRSAQDNTAKATQQAQQQTLAAAQSTQTGVQAALTEIGQGLQRIATNNPSLIPEVKNLYQSVSSKLSAASASATPLSSEIKPAKTQEQLADNLAKVALPGLQTPVL